PIVITVDDPNARIDEPVHVSVSGLRPGAEAVVSAETRDWEDHTWGSEATCVADAGGMVDPTRQAPRSGSYAGADGMGLFSFLEPESGDPDRGYYAPPQDTAVAGVRLLGTVGGVEKG